ncbi:hypothetical protein [Candidatus Corynebacterium faecigallinarum]|uniref:hypothetical protein n=1 Tax=Candidatus Corynebacterium faecigallinarum TaxID=2838528 RepID=UPI003FD1BEBB
MVSSRWFTTPVDVFAPWSYTMQFVRAPHELVVEQVAHALPSVSGSMGGHTSELGGVRQYDTTAPIDQWALLMRTGEKEFTDDPHAQYLGTPTLVARTVNPAWCVVLRGRDDTNNIQQQLRLGVHTPIVDDALAIYVQRYPETSELETYPKRVADFMHGSQGPHAVRVTGHAGLSPGKEMREYLHGTEITSGTKVKQCLHWPQDDPAYFYPGLEKMVKKKGTVVSRFTDDDIGDVMKLFGIDMFNPKFYTDQVTTLCTGVPPQKEYDPGIYDEYRDKYMPGWREERDYRG